MVDPDADKGNALIENALIILNKRRFVRRKNREAEKTNKHLLARRAQERKEYLSSPWEYGRSLGDA